MPLSYEPAPSYTYIYAYLKRSSCSIERQLSDWLTGLVAKSLTRWRWPPHISLLLTDAGDCVRWGAEDTAWCVGCANMLTMCRAVDAVKRKLKICVSISMCVSMWHAQSRSHSATQRTATTIGKTHLSGVRGMPMTRAHIHMRVYVLVCIYTYLYMYKYVQVCLFASAFICARTNFY